jgi:hypothetical protein
MAKLRHIALIVSGRPEKAAKFFEHAFEMKVAECTERWGRPDM